jgi:hypothetical protein
MVADDVLRTLSQNPTSLAQVIAVDEIPVGPGDHLHLFWRLKRHPWRGSLLVASGKVFALRES